MTEGDEYNDPILGRGIKIRFDKFSEMWTRHPNPEIDLAVMPLKLAVEECRRQGATPFYTTIQLNTIPNDNEWKEFIPIEDILMIGYPNGLWDDINNLPFFRRGITATHPGINYKGKDEFVIHTAIYPGSSGSPIFRLTEDFYKRSRNFQGGDDAVKLLGIAYKHLLYTAEAKIISETVAQKINVSSRILLDLGVVIRSNKLTDFQSILTQNRLEWEL